MSTDRPSLPLTGVVVIDVSTVIAGPTASLLLAELGAEVIRVEQPSVGDASRNLGTSAEAQGSWFKFLSQKKRFVTCRLSNPEGADLFKRLVARADIVIENFRPGTMERWGLGFDELQAANSRIIMLRISGYGQDGPYSHRPGYGTVVEAMSGLAHITGFPDGPPTLPGVPLADPMAGVTGVAGCLAALWRRERESDFQGELIDLSLYAPLVFAQGTLVAEHSVTGRPPMRRGNRLSNAPRNAAECADGEWIAYSAQSKNAIRSIVSLLGLEDDDRFGAHDAGYRFGEELDAMLVEWVGERDLEDVMNAFIKYGIPAGPVCDVSHLVQDPHMVARGEFVDVLDRTTGETVKLPRSPLRFRHSSSSVGTTGSDIGAENAAVYKELLGLEDGDLERLTSAGAI